MAIAFGTAGAVSAGTTSLTLAFPASISAGDLLVVFIASKYPANPPTQPAGFSTVGTPPSGGAGSSGVDSGEALATAFYKVADGTETGNLSVTITGGNTARGRIVRYTRSAGVGWEIAAAGGVDSSVGTSWSVTAGSDPGIRTDDFVVVLSAVNGNVATDFTSQDISSTGVTYGAMVQREDSGTANGDDCHLVVTEHPVSSGTSSAAPVYTMTADTSGANTPAGASLVVRLREANSITGAADITLGALTTSAAATAMVSGAASPTLDAVTTTAAGVVPMSGAAAITLEALTVTATTSTESEDPAVPPQQDALLQPMILPMIIAQTDMRYG